MIQTTWNETQGLSKRTRPSNKPISFSANGQLPLEQIQAWAQRYLVLQALDQLDEPCYRLLASWFLESKKCSPAEPAAQLGIAVHDIHSARARCFRKFDAILTEMDVDLGD